MAVLGNRQGQRDLLALYYQDGEYKTQVYDHDVGPTNVACYEYEGKSYIVSANREIDEIAWYSIEKI